MEPISTKERSVAFCYLFLLHFYRQIKVFHEKAWNCCWVAIGGGAGIDKVYRRQYDKGPKDS